MDYATVTEATGNRVTREALAMLYTRYRYAAQFCEGKDILEVACGAGQGLGYLAKRARSVIAGDYTANLLSSAQSSYNGRIPLVRLDGQILPFRTASFDVILLYEAIYYLAQPQLFFNECRRVLREKGILLLCTVNKEWSDFNPSPFSTRYFSAKELVELLLVHGFKQQLYGAFQVAKGSVKDSLVSLIKRVAVAWHLMPKTMNGKEVLKRVFLGPLSPLPAEVHDAMAPYCAPVPISDYTLASDFKILFAIAHLG